MALEFRAKNQHLRTGCLNVLLSLIDMLCQSLQDLSIDDLVGADSALTYVKDSGFKVDWLGKKLEEVKEKKKEEWWYADSRIRGRTERLEAEVLRQRNTSREREGKGVSRHCYPSNIG
ncbi:unnamed protein product [Arabis nemorensis]|uniref:MATH domain-containing protein n=1 Tax=Arabis nemorensis TaxID=586526 RepID=A0A565AVI6_9BRAS|nr:unnamed protein product [Arabis nemorensis]